MQYIIAENIDMEKVEESIVLIKNNGDAAVLNLTATSILESLLNGNSLANIVMEMAYKYEMEESCVYEDCNQLILDLLSKGLITKKQE